MGKDPKQLKRHKGLLRYFDLLIFPFIIFLLAFDPNSLHGIIDTLESGQYLSSINAAFHGKIPYKDFIPPVGPVFIWILSGILFLFGKTLYVLRLYFHISTTAVYIILYFLGRNLYRSKISAYMLPVIALVETMNPFWSSRWAGYSRFGAGLFGLFMLILYAKKARRSYLFISGLAAGFALLYGIDCGIFLIICGIALFILMAVYSPRGSLKKDIIGIVKRTAVFCCGLAAALIPFAVYMGLNRAFLPYLEGTYLIISHHVSAWKASLPSSLAYFRLYNNNLWLFLTSDEFKIYMPRFFYFLAICYIIRAFKKNRNITDCLAVPLLTIYGIFAYRSGCRVAGGPQFIVALLPLLVLLVYFTEKSLIFLLSNRDNLVRAGRSRGFAFCKTAALLVAVASPVYIMTSHKRVYGSWINWLKYQINKDETIPVYKSLARKDRVRLDTVDLERIGPVQASEEQARQLEAVTGYIRKNTSRDEAVFTFPEHGLYNFLADRPAVGRFYIAVYAHTVDRWKKELLSDLQADFPRYILYSRRVSNVARGIGMGTELLPEVIRFIKGSYHLEEDFGEIGIYKRNSL